MKKTPDKSLHLIFTPLRSVKASELSSASCNLSGPVEELT
jgi:hypothetical protein